MKVMFQSRKTLFSVPGGDTIQILKTKEYLERLGVEVDISLELAPNLYDYDLVHLFNIIRPQELLCQLENAKKFSKKVVISTIYVDFYEYDAKARGGLASLISSMGGRNVSETLKIVVRAAINGEIHKGVMQVILRGYTNALRYLATNSDLLLPNSVSEIVRLMRDLDIPISSDRIKVIPNGVDDSIFDLERVKKMEIPPEFTKFRDCLLCVARIEGRKNQLNLVKAVRGLPFQLVLVGDVAPNHKGYLKEVYKYKGENVHFLGFLPHDKLKFLYRLAKVHILPSWMETTGLSSLEAAIMGCNIVVTKKGDAEEYFKDLAFYCEPNDIESIKRAILSAYNYPHNGLLRKYILENFTWKHAAAKTLEAYKCALDSE